MCNECLIVQLAGEVAMLRIVARTAAQTFGLSSYSSNVETNQKKMKEALDKLDACAPLPRTSARCMHEADAKI